jgi:ribosome-binding factor A
MSHRLKQINNLIRQELDKLLLRELNLPKNCLVTITKVETSKDLRHAKIWVSILPFKYTGKIIRKLNLISGHLQFLLNKKLVLKPLPKINFMADTTEREAYEVEKLLDKIKERR